MKKKKENKYITLSSGLNFRTIAKKMTEKGFKMNHATARNALMVALKMLFENLSKKLQIELSESDIFTLLKSSHVHNALSDVFFEIHNEELKNA